MDIEKAMFDPGSVFDHPVDVFDEQSLTREQKIRLLKRWEYDARELSVAEEENMTGGPPNMLGEILQVLQRLDVEIDTGNSSPTKHGGE